MNRRDLKSRILAFILILFVGIMFLKSFAMERQEEESNADSTEVSKVEENKKVKEKLKDNVKAEEKMETDSLREEINRKMIENQIRNLRPKIPGLIRELQDSTLEPEYRQDCAYYLGCARDPRGISPLISALHDKWPQVRQKAIEGLVILCKYLKCDEKVKIALKKALKDSTLRVQLAAAKGLIELGDTLNPISVLVSIFKKEPLIFRESLNKWITQEILRPDLPDSEQVQLAKKWKEEAPLYALDLLIKIGNDQVISLLKNCLDTEDIWIQTKSRKAIDKIRRGKK
jgi:hypothetical protein